MTPLTNDFTAKWNSANQTLNPKIESCAWQVTYAVKNFFLYIPNALIAACVSPRAASPIDHEDIQVTTPDGVPLSVRFSAASTNAPLNTPTVILFNALGGDRSIHSTLPSQLSRAGFNVVTFNYRGYGTTRRIEDLVVDGEAMYQLVRDKHGVAENDIHFFGFSLGGAVATQVKALHPNSGKLVADRAFKSIFSLITEKLSISCLGPVAKIITNLVVAIFISYPVYYLGWELDGSKVISSIKGPAKYIYHPNDCLVPYNASLASCAKEPAQLRLSSFTIGSMTHFAPIDMQYLDANSQSASEAVVNFFQHS